jgi:hypothetical protein
VKSEIERNCHARSSALPQNNVRYTFFEKLDMRVEVESIRRRSDPIYVFIVLIFGCRKSFMENNEQLDVMKAKSI